MKLRKVKSLDEASGNALVLNRYRGDFGSIRGWFFGPVIASAGAARMPYEPKSKNLLAVVAIVRARQIAVQDGLEIDLIDPEGLWDEAWV